MSISLQICTWNGEEVAKSSWTVRRSQLITTYGVGAIIAVGDESVMVAGLDRWPSGDTDLHEARLEERLRVQGFKLPRATEDGEDVPVVRFPKWASCPNCRRLAHVSRFSGPRQHKCNKCDVPLVPSRFVTACQRGHIDDFPYLAWVHNGPFDRSGMHDLELEATGTSASLRDIVIKCSCGASRDMDGSFGKSGLRRIARCQGKRPWLMDEDPEPCPEMPRTFQRGGSNVWFPVVRSAISIPPWSHEAFSLLEQHWSLIRTVPEDVLPTVLNGYVGGRDQRFSVEQLVRVVLDRKSRERQPSVFDQEALRFQEYEALLQGAPERSTEDQFVCEQAEGLGGTTGQWFDRVMVARRLREVRAIQAFTRVLPASPGNPEEYRAPLSSQPLDWLPAVEVLGEGVFLRLHGNRLAEWESRPSVVKRADIIDTRYRGKFKRQGTQADRRVSPRLLMIHTLAHVLIDQWSLDSGYPAAALRERLFVSDRMAGLMIYTATSDSAGSLGGVVGQASPDLLDRSLRDAMERAGWCSNDPVCSETEAQGAESLNLAACHSCVLLPEVSCEEMNQLLDRGLLIGTPIEPDLGFFVELSTPS